MSINYQDIINMPLPGEGMGQPQDIIGDHWGGPEASLDPSTAGGAGGVPYRPGMAPPEVYYAGSEFDILRGLTTEDRVRLQQQLIAVGLAGNVVFGEVDDNSMKAMRSVLSMANRAGEDWRQTLGRISTNPEILAAARGGRDRADFEPEPYLAPDYATIAQRVKSQFREALGRDPDQGEMAELVAELQGWDRQSYQAGVSASRLAFDQAQQPGTQGGGTVQSVDPMARFAELFESKYRHELDFVEDKQDAQLSREVVESGTDTLSSMSRGRM